MFGYTVTLRNGKLFQPVEIPSSKAGLLCGLPIMLASYPPARFVSVSEMRLPTNLKVTVLWKAQQLGG